eukprot:9018298-Pyramimonas_sp.AAC.2
MMSVLSAWATARAMSEVEYLPALEATSESSAAFTQSFGWLRISLTQRVRMLAWKGSTRLQVSW